MVQSGETVRGREWAPGPIPERSRKDGGTDIDTVIEEERSGEVSSGMEVHEIGDRQRFEADGAAKVADPVCIDRRCVVSTSFGLAQVVANMMSALSQAIHEDVLTLGNRVDQLHVRTERLQTYADREPPHQVALRRRQEEGA